MQGAAPSLLVWFLIAGAPCLTHAGTTVITHGFAANSTMPPGWTLTMAEAILAADGDPSDCGAIGGETPVGTVFSYSPDSGTWDFYCGSDTPNGEIALVFNWAEESDSADSGGTQGFAEAAADALYAALRDPWLAGNFVGVDLLATTSWEIVSFDIPAQSVGLTQTLRFALDGGGDGVEAVVDLDDLHFVPEQHGALLLAAGGAVLFGLAHRREARREPGR